VQLKPDSLGAHLKSQLAPVYLIAGDEPLLVGECADAVRAAARARGHDSREVLFAERGLDGAALAASGASMSLFLSKRIIEVRLPTGKPGDGADALVEYAARPADDAVLLVISQARPDKRMKWLNALADAGVFVAVYPLEAHQYPEWLARRARGLGLELEPEAVERLRARTEGNLLAAAQELELLALARGRGKVDAAAVEAAVADSARFDAFQMVDAALAGDAARALRALDVLAAEGEALALVSWAVAKDLRILAQFAARVADGEPVGRVVAHPMVWQNRRGLYESALTRVPLKRWRRLLQQALVVDRTLKGQRRGVDPWTEMRGLVATLAGSFDAPRGARAARRG
jgi:DNA polymerase-3 subunit delta